MTASTSFPVTRLGLLLSVTLPLIGCSHTDAIATPTITPLREAGAMTQLSQPELFTALTRMIRGAKGIKEFSADEVSIQLGHPLKLSAEYPDYFGTSLSLADGSKLDVEGFSLASPEGSRLNLEFRPALGQCPLSVATLQPVLADAGATPARWRSPMRLGSPAYWQSEAEALVITATVDGKHGETDTNACIQRINLYITGER